MVLRKLETRPATAVVVLILAALCIAPLARVAWGQEEPTQVPEPTPTPAPTPIPAADIPGSAAQAESKFRELTQDTAPVKEITEIEEGFVAAAEAIEKLSDETEALLAEDLTSASSTTSATGGCADNPPSMAGWRRFAHVRPLSRRTSRASGWKPSSGG
jgi:hypothetical protein